MSTKFIILYFLYSVNMIMMDVGQHGFYHIIINFEMSYLTYCIVLSAE